MFQPGDYIFIQVPAIARYEWHPFTISSAPEVQGTFSLHIRGVGSWTNKLYEYFERRDNVKQSLQINVLYKTVHYHIEKWKPLPNTDNNKLQVEHSSSKILNDVVIKLDCNKSSDVIQVIIIYIKIAAFIDRYTLMVLTGLLLLISLKLSMLY